MKFKRLRGCGKRWKKGDSCISNPSETKHRKAAMGRFFQKTEGGGGITQEALAQHDAALSQMSGEVEALSICEDDLKSAGKSLNTFATSFTSCTIPAFEKFFFNYNAKSELHNRMLAIHAAAQEYMRENDLEETSTSYFCTLLVSLKGISDNENDVSATLSLMTRVIRRVPQDVLQSMFQEHAKALDDVLSMYQRSDLSPLIINAIGSMSVLLRAQEERTWNDPLSAKLLNKILDYVTEAKPKIRRAAHYNVCAILHGSSFMRNIEKEAEAADTEASVRIHPAAAEVGNYIIQQLQSASSVGNIKTVLHLLVFLRQVITAFDKKQLKALCECILSMIQLRNPFINQCALQSFQKLFEAHPDKCVLSVKVNVALINALTAQTVGSSRISSIIIPGMNDPTPCEIWIDVVTSAAVNLYRLDVTMGLKHIQLWFQQISVYWRSDFTSVHAKVSESLEKLLEECVSSLDETMATSHRETVESLCHSVEGGMSFQYQSAWAQVFKTVGVCFTVVGPHLPEMFYDPLKNMSELVNNPDLPQKVELEQAIGSAVKGLGPEAVMKIIPLQISGNIYEDEKNFWVLPLLRNYVQKTRISFFKEYFIPLAGKCFEIVTVLKDKGHETSLLSKTYKTIEQQIWALLPSFCKEAVDVESAIDREFAMLLANHIQHRDDTRIDVLSALRNLIACTAENGKLVGYAKNYLPVLFNIYRCRPRHRASQNSDVVTVQKGHREAAYSTVVMYLRIVKKSECDNFIKTILEKYRNEIKPVKKQNAPKAKGNFMAGILLDLIRAFLPYISAVRLKEVYDTLVSRLNCTSENYEIKALYKALEQLLSIGTAEGVEFITENLEVLSSQLLESVSTVKLCARAPRLRCIRLILMQMDGRFDRAKCEVFFKKVVAEAIACCSGQKTDEVRKAAFLLLSEMGATLQRMETCDGQETVRKCLQLLLAGLVGPSSLASNTVLALTAFTYQYKDIVPQDVLQLMVHNISILMKSSAREIVNACLSFFKTCLIIFPPPVMSEYVNSLVESICSMALGTQRKYRIKVKQLLVLLTRKFGADRIAALVPKEEVYLHKRLKNIRKAIARKGRKKESVADGNDADNEGSEEETTKTSLFGGMDEILAEIDAITESDGEDEKGSKRKAVTAKGKKQHQKTWIKEEEDNIVDLLDSSAGQALASKNPKAGKAKPRTERRDDQLDFPIDKRTGKLIIMEEKENEDEDSDEMSLDDVDDFLKMKAGAVQGKIKKRKRTGSKMSLDEPPAKKKASNNVEKKAVPKAKKRKHSYGAEYRAKRAGGDRAVKGKLQPYAYVPMSKESLNRRKQAKYAGQFKYLVKGVRKGVSRGQRMKNKRKK